MKDRTYYSSRIRSYMEAFVRSNPCRRINTSSLLLGFNSGALARRACATTRLVSHGGRTRSRGGERKENYKKERQGQTRRQGLRAEGRCTPFLVDIQTYLVTRCNTHVGSIIENVRTLSSPSNDEIHLLRFSSKLNFYDRLVKRIARWILSSSVS